MVPATERHRRVSLHRRCVCRGDCLVPAGRGHPSPRRQRRSRLQRGRSLRSLHLDLPAECDELAHLARAGWRLRADRRRCNGTLVPDPGRRPCPRGLPLRQEGDGCGRRQPGSVDLRAGATGRVRGVLHHIPAVHRIRDAGPALRAVTRRIAVRPDRAGGRARQPAWRLLGRPQPEPQGVRRRSAARLRGRPAADSGGANGRAVDRRDRHRLLPHLRIRRVVLCARPSQRDPARVHRHCHRPDADAGRGRRLLHPDNFRAPGTSHQLRHWLGVPGTCHDCVRADRPVGAERGQRCNRNDRDGGQYPAGLSGSQSAAEEAG